jgi:hypothetical protein
MSGHRRLLHGYKQVGKRFIPPLKQLLNVQEIGYVNDMLPELIWIGLINDRLGFVQGARFLERVVSAAVKVDGSPPYKNYALISQIGSISSDNKQQLISELDRNSILELLRLYISPLVLLYDACPISFLGPPSTVYERKDLTKLIKRCVGAILISTIPPESC